MALTLPTTLYRLGRLLSGEFDNRQQALADPAWYVHLRLWHRHIRLFEADSLTFFIEQVSVASGQAPYRQRLLRLQPDGDQLLGRYYGLKHPQSFQGAATNPQHLQALSQDDLVDLPSCQVKIVPTATGFQARMRADEPCQFTYQGKTTFIRLGFDIGHISGASEAVEFAMYDKGIDPTSGQATWGALLGPFRLVKQQTFKDSF